MRTTSGGFERGGRARPPKPLFDHEAMAFVHEIYQRADAFLFGRRTYELFAGYWGTKTVVVGQGTRLFPDAGPDIALDLLDSRAFPRGVTLQVYRPAERPQYAAATAD